MQPIRANDHCLCKTVRYSITGPVRNLCYCHCQSCRRASGSAFVAWGTVDANDFNLVAGHLNIVHSSNEVSRGFCGACGSSLTYQHALHSEEIDFTLVSLEDASMFSPEMHIWVNEKLPWVQINDSLPRHQTIAG